MLRLVADGRDHFLRVMAGGIAFQFRVQPALSAGIGAYLGLITRHLGHRHRAPQNGRLPFCLRRFKFPRPALHIGHAPADQSQRQFQSKGIDRLQQHTLCPAQPLSDCPVSGLPEISALSMLLMSLPRCQRDPHIRDRCPRQHPRVLPFLQMGQHEPLPVPVQIVFADSRGKLQPAARITRLQDQVHLRVMPERLEMTYAFHPVDDRLLVDDTALLKSNLHAKPLPDQITQHLDLHLTHQLCMNFIQLLFPDKMQLRLLFFQLT